MKPGTPPVGCAPMEIPGGRPRTEAEATAVQETLRGKVDTSDHLPPPGARGSLAVGLDVAYDDERDALAAAAVAVDVQTLETVGQATATGRVAFPYVPGLLAFREIPALLDALAALERTLGRAPGVLVCDGYGRAHPRRFGLASHLGVLTGLPSFGVAKSPFVFAHPEVGALRGDSAPLLDGVEEVGRALRTRAGVKPVYVSAGHRAGLESACALTLALAPEFRLPETTRRADALCRETLRLSIRHAQ